MKAIIVRLTEPCQFSHPAITRESSGLIRTALQAASCSPQPDTLSQSMREALVVIHCFGYGIYDVNEVLFAIETLWDDV